MRQTLKVAIEKALRLSRGDPARMGGRSLILAYHNVVPDEERGRGDASLHLRWTSFLHQMDVLETHCDVVPLADLLACDGPTHRPRVAISFDDAYRGAVDLALPELARRGFPCTLFIAPGLLGQRSFWWDELAESSQGLSRESRQVFLDVEGGRAERIRAAKGAAFDFRPLPELYGCATEAEIRALDGHPSVSVGSHSWSHPNLTRIGPSELEKELVTSLVWLEATVARPLSVLAYPYGRSSPAVEQAAERAGYSAAVLVDGGWMGADGARNWSLPRYNIPAGLSGDGFVLRLSGFFTA